MIDLCCIELKDGQLVKVKERGQQAVFVNDDNAFVEVIKCDKCVMPENTSADFVVSKYGVGDVVVELKGKGVEKALKQIMATAEHWKQNKYRHGRIAGLIVSKQCPSGSTSVQKAKEKFRNDFAGPLHITSRKEPFEFHNLHSFKGPYKK